MKLSRAFIVVIIALMAAMILFETSAPSSFKWDDYSQSTHSKQPFGCYVMDSVLRASLPQGYEVLGQDIEMYIGKKPKGGKHTFFLTNNYTDFISSFDINLLKLIEEGNNVLLATEYTYGDLHDELGFSIYHTDYYYYYRIPIEKELSDHTRYDTIMWHRSQKFAPASYIIHNAFCNQRLILSGSFRTLATLNRLKESIYDYEPENKTPDIMAGVRYFGKGKLVVVSMPMIFTNYGILNDTIRPLALRLLSECGNLPIVRYDRSVIGQAKDDEQESGSPLRYLLANRPLRWAFYLALATLVAFVLFSARRRQRVIPVIQAPVNHMMDFVKRIGGIYYKRHDNVDLLIKKYATFGNEVRSKAMINIDNYDHIDEELQSLSNRTGIPFDELQKQIFDVWNATNADSISDERLRQLIDVMNNIQQRINI